MRHPARLAVFASGGGTNLQALLDTFNRASSAVARVELVVASRAGIGALAKAESAGVPTAVVNPVSLPPAAAAAELLRALERSAIDLIVLAGYLKLVPGEVIDRYAERIINIHPALLPAFGGPGMYGLRVHRAVLESGATVSGATVHRVGARYDEGPIVAQWPVPVLPGDTPESLATRILRVEHLLLPAAVDALVTGGSVATIQDEISFELTPAAVPKLDSVRRLLR